MNIEVNCPKCGAWVPLASISQHMSLHNRQAGG